MDKKKIKPLPQPCIICKNRKPNTPIKIRDDNGTLFKCTFIAHCPYCGRFLEEDYNSETTQGNERTILRSESK